MTKCQYLTFQILWTVEHRDISFTSSTPLDVIFLTPYVFRSFEKSCEIFRTPSEINCISIWSRRSLVTAPNLVVLFSTDSPKRMIWIITVNNCQDQSNWNKLAFALNAIKTRGHNEAIQWLILKFVTDINSVNKDGFINVITMLSYWLQMFSTATFTVRCSLNLVPISRPRLSCSENSISFFLIISFFLQSIWYKFFLWQIGFYFYWWNSM